MATTSKPMSSTELLRALLRDHSEDLRVRRQFDTEGDPELRVLRVTFDARGPVLTVGTDPRPAHDPDQGTLL